MKACWWDAPLTLRDLAEAIHLKVCNFIIKKGLQHKCFPVNTAKFLRAAFFIEHLWWLLLQLLRKTVFFKIEIEKKAVKEFSFC